MVSTDDEMILLTNWFRLNRATRYISAILKITNNKINTIVWSKTLTILTNRLDIKTGNNQEPIPNDWLLIKKENPPKISRQKTKTTMPQIISAINKPFFRFKIYGKMFSLARYFSVYNRDKITPSPSDTSGKIMWISA